MPTPPILTPHERGQILTPYDRGTVLEPKPWETRYRSEPDDFTAIERASFGRVDFDNSSSESIISALVVFPAIDGQATTIEFQANVNDVLIRETEGDVRICIEPQGAVETIERAISRGEHAIWQSADASEDPGTQLGDLLADLMHWAAANDVSFIDSLSRGVAAYRADIEGWLK